MNRAQRRRTGVLLPLVATVVSLVAILSCLGEPPETTIDSDRSVGDAAPAPPLGVDTGTGASDAGADAFVLEPIAVDTHFFTTCAVLTNGRVHCWGNNDTLQAGDATGGDVVRQPVEVAGVADAVDVSTGYQHSCAVTRSGSVFCWGANERGQLGRTTAETGLRTATAFEVQGLPVDARVDRISVGNDYACALAKSAKIYCWGADTGGALYAPDAGAQERVPPTELVVPGNPSLLFVSVRAQISHTCAVATTGGAYCWGDNAFSQLGRAGASGLPELGQSSSSSKASVVSGDVHTCLFDAENGPRCFGWNLFGQLGSAVPPGDQTTVALHIPGFMTGASSASAGIANTCVRFTDNTVSCVGSNAHAQLADPAQDGGNHTVPVKVPALVDALSITVGTEHVCALRAGGGASGKKSVACWGSNRVGQLGIDSDAGTGAPSVVGNLD